MPRKELSAPSENRKKAVRLFDDDDRQNDDFEEITDCGCDRNEFSDSFEPSRKPKSKQKTARQYAMNLVSVKTYTERAIREKLKMRGYGCDETDDAIEYLRSFGYINDLRLAQNTALRLAKGLSGKKKIFAYLTSKGIKSDVISQIDFDEVDFKENCKALALKHVAMGKSYEQTAAALMRAGFSSSEIYYAMSAVES